MTSQRANRACVCGAASAFQPAVAPTLRLLPTIWRQRLTRGYVYAPLHCHVMALPSLPRAAIPVLLATAPAALPRIAITRLPGVTGAFPKHNITRDEGRKAHEHGCNKRTRMAAGAVVHARLSHRHARFRALTAQALDMARRWRSRALASIVRAVFLLELPVRRTTGSTLYFRALENVWGMFGDIVSSAAVGRHPPPPPRLAPPPPTTTPAPPPPGGHGLGIWKVA